MVSSELVLLCCERLLLDDLIVLGLCDLFTDLFEVLTLEHHGFNLFNLKVEGLVDILLHLSSFFCLLDLLFCLSLELFVVFDAFPYQQVNVDFCLPNGGGLGFHDLLSTTQKRVFKLLLVQICVLAGGCLALNHDLVKFELDSLSSHYLLFYAVLANKPIDVDLFLLADPIRTIHRL